MCQTESWCARLHVCFHCRPLSLRPASTTLFPMSMSNHTPHELHSLLFTQTGSYKDPPQAVDIVLVSMTLTDSTEQQSFENVVFLRL